MKTRCKTPDPWYKWLVDFAMSNKRYRLKGNQRIVVEVLEQVESRQAARMKRKALLYRDLRDNSLSVRDEAEFNDWFEPAPS